MSALSIRRLAPADPVDLAELRQVEREASSIFADADIPAGERGGVTELHQLRAGQAAGLLWIASDAGRPVGFALVGWADGEPHLLEIGVRQSQGRRGVGRALAERGFDPARRVAMRCALTGSAREGAATPRSC
jgi:ribosomal protein S18 acetylase RimI-like enzyme